MTLDDAVAFLCETYLPLDMAAGGLIVDPAEVSAALATAEPDTAEYVALTLLAARNPVPPAPVKTSTKPTAPIGE